MRAEMLRRARILDGAADLCEQNWAKLDEIGSVVRIGPGPKWNCAWTGISTSAPEHDAIPVEWRCIIDEIARWNDAQPGPEPVVRHLRESAARHRTAAAGKAGQCER